MPLFFIFYQILIIHLEIIFLNILVYKIILKVYKFIVHILVNFVFLCTFASERKQNSKIYHIINIKLFIINIE